MCERTEEADDEETRLTVGGELAEEHGHRVVLLHQVDHRKTTNRKKIQSIPQHSRRENPEELAQACGSWTDCGHRLKCGWKASAGISGCVE